MGQMSERLSHPCRKLCRYPNLTPDGRMHQTVVENDEYTDGEQPMAVDERHRMRSLVGSASHRYSGRNLACRKTTQ